MATTGAPRRGRAKIMAPRKHGPEFSADKTWSELSKNIREIQNQNASNLSFEENHRFAYNMVLNKNGELLYNGLKQLVVEDLGNLAAGSIISAFPTGTTDASVQSVDDDLLLAALKDVWIRHINNMVRLGQILKYMDRVYTKTANVPATNELGLQLFLRHIIRPPIKGHIMTAILNQIRHERDGYVINRSTMKGCIDVYMSLEGDASGTTIYKLDLEPAILKESEAFYSRVGKELLDSCTAPVFLQSVEQRLEAEEDRVHHYLSSHTKPPLLQILQDNLLSPHLQAIISKENSGLDAMVDNNQFDDLSRLYRLSIMVPHGLPYLKTSLKDSIVRRGKEINDGSTEDDFIDVVGDIESSDKKAKGKGKARGPASGIQPAVKWVQNVLSLKDTFDKVWELSFQRDREVESSINGAFASFINMNEKCSEFISLFIDDHLRRGLKGKNETEVDEILDKTMTVFRFIAEKDVFEKYYKGHLAKRLLHARSVSDDAERGMLAKLKVECGVQFTQKMEGMFNDMRISADTTRAYLDHVSKTTAPDVELSVTVMTMNAWPMNHSPSSCVLPSVMSKATKSFEQFYFSRHSGRRLTWQLSLGNADVTVQFKAQSHELNVSTFSLVILLLFEDLGNDDFLSYQEIKAATDMEEAELKRQLQSLACAKWKVLKKQPAGRDVNPDDTFSFNDGFSCPLTKVKIGLISSKVENSTERKETRDRIDEERKHQMEACIVRIMKNRKHMTHNDLINEVTSQLTTKFHPEPLAIKKRIEQLIEREYLERCEDRKSYNYLA